MFKDKLNKLIERDKEEGNNKKKIENLVFFVVVLIITIVVINVIWNDKNTSKDTKEVDNNKKLATTNQVQAQTGKYHKNKLSQKLESILSKIQGVGDVKVFINYSESSEVVAMYNENSKSSTTEETDTSGGVRKIQETDSQKDVIFQENDGVKHL